MRCLPAAGFTPSLSAAVTGPRGILATGCRAGNFSTPASLANIVASSAKERRAGRGGSAGRSDRGSFTVVFPHGLPDPSPKLADLRSGLAVRRELGDAKAGAERILVVDALYDVGERQRAGRMQRQCGLADAAAARRRLVEHEGEWLAEFANGA